MKIGLTLSGGGARGIAHIGVLKALEERNINVDVVSAASSGALIAALYCAGKSPEEILELSKKYSFLSLIKPIIPMRGFASLDTIHKVLTENIEEDKFENLKIPLYIAVTNMYKGCSETISSGELAKIVQASCSIPVLFKLVKINNQEYGDGGVMNNFPANSIRDKCDVLIGVNLIVNPNISTSSLSSVIKVAKRTFELQAYSNSKPNLELCDLVITPRKLQASGVFQTKNIDTLYEIGYRSACQQLDKLMPKLLKNKENVS